jgi:hypothetical protein
LEERRDRRSGGEKNGLDGPGAYLHMGKCRASTDVNEMHGAGTE